jgi:hypothetical protein
MNRDPEKGTACAQPEWAERNFILYVGAGRPAIFVRSRTISGWRCRLLRPYPCRLPVFTASGVGGNFKGRLNGDTCFRERGLTARPSGISTPM